MFHRITSSILILFLLCSMSPSIAEEDSLQARAITDAKRDANNYNALLWTLGGLLAPTVPVGAIALGLFDNTSAVAGLACLCAPNAAAMLLPSRLNVRSPSERLIGKSSEYVSVYANTYKKEVVSKRQSFVAVGCVVGCLISGYIFINNWEPYWF